MGDAHGIPSLAAARGDAGQNTRSINEGPQGPEKARAHNVHAAAPTIAPPLGVQAGDLHIARAREGEVGVAAVAPNGAEIQGSQTDAGAGAGLEIAALAVAAGVQVAPTDLIRGADQRDATSGVLSLGAEAAKAEGPLGREGDVATAVACGCDQTSDRGAVVAAGDRHIAGHANHRSTGGQVATEGDRAAAVDRHAAAAAIVADRLEIAPHRHPRAAIERDRSAGLTAAAGDGSGGDRPARGAQCHLPPDRALAGDCARGQVTWRRQVNRPADGVHVARGDGAAAAIEGDRATFVTGGA